MKNLLLLIISGVILLSCGKKSDLIFIDRSPNPTRIQKEELVTFDVLNQQILTPHCISCHKKSGTEEGIAKWVVPGEPEKSKLFNSVKEGRMPKRANPLPLKDVELIRQYIVDLPKIQRLEKIDFETLKNEILVPHCLTCHQRMDNEENLQKWVDQSEPMKSRLLQSVIEGKMPKKGEKLSKTEIELITKYLNQFIR